VQRVDHRERLGVPPRLFAAAMQRRTLDEDLTAGRPVSQIVSSMAKPKRG
jgi:hypothetical protein